MKERERDTEETSFEGHIHTMTTMTNTKSKMSLNNFDCRTTYSLVAVIVNGTNIKIILPYCVCVWVCVYVYCMGVVFARRYLQ